MAYIDDLNTMTEVTFDKILGLASHYLPEVNRNAPWIGLNHGTKVLQSETELCQYLCAYGNLHRNKINILKSATIIQYTIKGRFMSR